MGIIKYLDKLCVEWLDPPPVKGVSIYRCERCGREFTIGKLNRNMRFFADKLSYRDFGRELCNACLNGRAEVNKVLFDEINKIKASQSRKK